VIKDLLLLVLVFVAVLALGNRTHLRLQQVFTLLTNDRLTGEKLYYSVVFPGVALHELSHAVTAVLLRVRVRRFSLRPRAVAGNKLQLGFVETDRSDVLRGSLIGAAPLLAGIGVLLAVSRGVFGLHDVFTAAAAFDLPTFFTRIAGVFATPYAFAWALLTHVVVICMTPSRSDMRAWPPVLGGMAAIGALIYVVGNDAVREWAHSGALFAAHQLGGALLFAMLVQLPALLLIEAAFSMLLRARRLR